MATTGSAFAAFPGTNGKIAWAGGGGGGDPYELRAKTDVQSAGYDYLGNNVRYPAWSADGSKIAFARNGDIFVSDYNGSTISQTVNLTNDPADDTKPSWSPSGAKIAFSSDRAGGNRDIYTLEVANPANVARLTTDSAIDDDPAFSPTTHEIAFVTTRYGNSELAKMADTGGAITRRFTSTTSSEGNPDWSPDGTNLIYGSNYQGISEIYRIPAGATGSATAVTSNGFSGVSTSDPVYSPDGTRIAYTWNYPGYNNEVMTRSASGDGNPFRIVGADTSHHNSDPTWRTVGYTGGGLAPNTPTITGVDSANLVHGNADAGSTVKLYADSSCSGTILDSGDASEFGSPGLQGTAATPLFYALASNSNGPSGCSAGFANPNISYDRLISGRKIQLKVSPSGNRGFQLESRDYGILTPSNVATAGVTLSLAGSGLDESYTLPPAGWIDLGDGRFKYKDSHALNGPITSAEMRGGVIKAKGKGVGLGFTLSTDPGPVNVKVAIPGQPSFCMGFGGTVRFRVDRYFKASDALAPASCS